MVNYDHLATMKLQRSKTMPEVPRGPTSGSTRLRFSKPLTSARYSRPFFEISTR